MNFYQNNVVQIIEVLPESVDRKIMINVLLPTINGEEPNNIFYKFSYASFIVNLSITILDLQ